jgi:hypothetical protein
MASQHCLCDVPLTLEWPAALVAAVVVIGFIYLARCLIRGF